MRETHGRIDALVLNGSPVDPVTLRDGAPEHLDRHFAVNVRGAGSGMQAALGAMGRHGPVMQVRAIAGLMGVMPDGTYAATKAALRSDARTWTAELAAQDIRLNVGALGPTETAVRARVPEARWARLIAPIRLGRMARPERGRPRCSC
jgi:NAD(P)-dependent dehydrogenase (short-subunit alcohol dehydrogenase family)